MDNIIKWIKRYRKELLSFEILFSVLIIAFAVYLYVRYNKEHFAVTYQGLSAEAIEIAKRSRIQLPKERKRWKLEDKCRTILERLYNKQFVTVRPDFLKNPVTGRNLEIDCYNEELKLGLEYDGIQHSTYTPIFHRRGANDFIYGTLKDEFKTKRCKELGITLIRIPHYILEEDLETYIIKRLRAAGKY